MNILQILAMNDEEWMNISEIARLSTTPDRLVPDVLKTLEARGYVVSKIDDEGHTVYSITDRGRAQLKSCRQRTISASTQVSVAG